LRSRLAPGEGGGHRGAAGARDALALLAAVRGGRRLGRGRGRRPEQDLEALAARTAARRLLRSSPE
jgi:hypothetical protein